MARGASRELWSRASNKSDGFSKDDLESARTSSRKPRFKDMVHSVVEDNKRKKLQQKLQHGLNEMTLEEYRKSPDEVIMPHVVLYTLACEANPRGLAEED